MLLHHPFNGMDGRRRLRKEQSASGYYTNGWPLHNILNRLRVSFLKSGRALKRSFVVVGGGQKYRERL